MAGYASFDNLASYGTLSAMDWRETLKSLGIIDILSSINWRFIFKLLVALWLIFSVALVIYAVKYK